jgi:hypothetical protein
VSDPALVSRRSRNRDLGQSAEPGEKGLNSGRLDAVIVAEENPERRLSESGAVQQQKGDDDEKT